MDERAVLRGAQEVLAENWRGAYTLPSPGLYPHQWNWDSALIAMGNAYEHAERGAREIETLLEAQWANGMVPHEVFAPDSARTYFPGPAFLDVHRNPDAPDDRDTTPLTQPPLLAMAAWAVAQRLGVEDANAFLGRVLPKIEAYHAYLLTVRDPENSGGVTLVHPWESGMDNSPVWDGPLERVDTSTLEPYARKDLEHVRDAGERPDDARYDQYIAILARLREGDHDIEALYDDLPFKVKGVGLTSLLYADMRFLQAIAERIGENTSAIEGRRRQVEEGFIATFCPDREDDLLTYCYDVVGGEHIRKPTIASLLPLYGGLVPSRRLGDFIENFDTSRFCGHTCHVAQVPSTALDSDSYSERAYWRGPVWVNMNWMVYYGMLQYGFEERAATIREGLLHLASDHGFREYYDPQTGEGYGADRFSWTAACVIDLVHGGLVGGPPGDPAPFT